MGLPLETRSLMRYHPSKRELMPICYSRDAMADPLRHLSTTLAKIGGKVFQPDLTRSGYLAPASSSSSSCSSSSPADSDFDAPIPQCARVGQ